MTEPTPGGPGRETRSVDVRGRTITIQKLVDAQMLLMAREAKILQRDDVGGERKMTATAHMFDMLETMVVTEEDREYLLQLIIDGNLELKELMGFISVFTEDDEAKPKVRRGRPPVKR
jgi:BioD-like phosphotransacetylase family protein